jgi:hypothetical protein
MRIINWSGDSWLHSLTAPDILEMCHQFDLQPELADEFRLTLKRVKGLQVQFHRIRA